VYGNGELFLAFRGVGEICVRVRYLNSTRTYVVMDGALHKPVDVGIDRPVEGTASFLDVIIFTPPFVLIGVLFLTAAVGRTVFRHRPTIITVDDDSRRAVTLRAGRVRIRKPRVDSK